MTAKIPGVIVSMGGGEWTVPPLTLGQLRRLMPKVKQLTNIGAAMGEEQIGCLVEIITAAMERNYPDVTVEKVENELLDLGNANEVLNAILTGSGLRRSGEAQAKSSNGAISTGSSPMRADSALESSTN